MTFEEFETGMNKLKSCYGEKAFPEVKIDLIYSRVKNFMAFQWNETVDYLILNNRYSPQMKDIYEAKEASRGNSLVESESQIRDRLIKSRNNQPCGWCDSYGIIVTEHKHSTGSPFAFRCDKCNAAEVLKISKNIKIWEQLKYENHRVIILNDQVTALLDP